MVSTLYGSSMIFPSLVTLSTSPPQVFPPSRHSFPPPLNGNNLNLKKFPVVGSIISIVWNRRCRRRRQRRRHIIIRLLVVVAVLLQVVPLLLLLLVVVAVAAATVL